MGLLKFGKVCHVLESKNPRPSLRNRYKGMWTCKEKYVG